MGSKASLARARGAHPSDTESARPRSGGLFPPAIGRMSRARGRVRPLAAPEPRNCGLGRLLDDLVEADLLGRLGDERRAETLLDGLLGHDALLHVAPGRKLELDVEQGLLEDRPQAARARLAGKSLVSDRGERLVGEDELDPVELEEALELL